jgi:imidazolonepropionase-like amidohydrolase
MFRATLSFLFSLTFLTLLPAQSPVKALVGGTLIDGYGGAPIQNSVVIIQGDRIKEVGTQGSVPIPANAEVISTEGMSVLPGLWDMHVHLMINGHSDYGYWDKTYPPLFRDVIMPSSAEQLLMAGVTSARDLGAPLEDILYVRDAINRGDLPGPTLYVSGPFIQKEPYPGTEAFRWGVDGADDARAKVRRLAEAGVDVIKLIDQDQMTMAEAKAVVDEAHKHGLKVVAHGHRPDEIRVGLAAGADNFEHTGLSSAPGYPEDVMQALRERTADMSQGPLYWTPTISVLWNYQHLVENPEILDNDSWHRGLPDSIVTDIRASIRRPGQLPYYQLTPLRIPTLRDKFEQLQSTGMVLMIGTDSGVPMTFHSQSTWNELDIWVNELGVAPLTAIKAATYWPAQFMGVADEVGTITPGKKADIIAVQGDVLRHIALLQRVDLIIKNGKHIK